MTSPRPSARRSSPCPRTPGRRAQDAAGEPRENGQVAELTEHLDLTGWPERSRVIVRRERPHSGAQLSFSDHDGHRSQAILTDQPDPDVAALERLHRARARDEDRIRAAKDCGLQNLPFRDFDVNAFWLELVLNAQDLAQGIAKRTIAEFVTDQETSDLLRASGVDYAQDFHTGPPVPINDVLAGLAT